MKANELRVGNWVRKKGSDTKIQVDPSILNVSELINYQPIPLTPEILEKCGFVVVSSWTYSYPLKGNLKFFYYIGERGWCIGLKQYADFRCEYLHQLQNTIHALTGEELKYQP